MNLLNALNTNTYSYNANRIKTEKKQYQKSTTTFTHNSKITCSLRLQYVCIWYGKVGKHYSVFTNGELGCYYAIWVTIPNVCVCVSVSVYINYMVFAVYFKIHKTTLTLTIYKTIYADFVSLDSFLGKCIRTLVYKHIRTLRKKNIANWHEQEMMEQRHIVKLATLYMTDNTHLVSKIKAEQKINEFLWIEKYPKRYSKCFRRPSGKDPFNFF